MRQILVSVPQGHGQEVLKVAARYDALNTVQLSAQDGQEERDLIIVNVKNKLVGPLADALEQFPDMHLTLGSQDVMPMQPPTQKVADAISKVTHRSPLEVWLQGLQSVGSWRGFLAYAVLAGVVVWIGLFTNTSYLLVGAMLIAPFGGPAMNIALATASGDRDLLLRNLARYCVSLPVLIAITALLSLLYGQTTATTSMVDVSELSAVAVLLPLAAGAGGALSLVQASSSSLVSGTVVGLLVAASLAPPAGMTGMAVAIGRWGMASNGIFTLFLQLFAINLSGSIVFRVYGLSASGPRYSQGKSHIFTASVLVSAVALIGMLVWQFQDPPSLTRSTRSQEAVGIVDRVITSSQLVTAVEINMRFTRPEEENEETLLGVIFVERRPEATGTDAQIADVLRNNIQEALREEGFNVRPLLSITVLEPPDFAEVGTGGT